MFSFHLAETNSLENKKKIYHKIVDTKKPKKENPVKQTEKATSPLLISTNSLEKQGILPSFFSDSPQKMKPNKPVESLSKRA